MSEKPNRWKHPFFDNVNPGAGCLLHDKGMNPRSPDYFGIYKFEEDAHYKEGDVLRIVGWTSKSGKVISLRKESEYLPAPRAERKPDYKEISRGGDDDIPF